MNAIYLHPVDGFTFLENVPEKPIKKVWMSRGECGCHLTDRCACMDYELTLAACIEKRMVIGNPKIVNYMIHGDKIEGELYPWPGTWYKAKQFRYKPNSTDGGWTEWLDGGTSIPDKEIERREVVILSPQKEEKPPIKGLFGGDNLHCRPEDIAKAEENEQRNNPDERPLAVEGSQVVGVKEPFDPNQVIASDIDSFLEACRESGFITFTNKAGDIISIHGMMIHLKDIIRAKSEPVVSQDQEELCEEVISFIIGSYDEEYSRGYILSKIMKKFTITRNP